MAVISVGAATYANVFYAYVEEPNKDARVPPLPADMISRLFYDLSNVDSLILANLATAESGLVRTGTETQTGDIRLSLSRTRGAARAMEYWARQMTVQSSGFIENITFVRDCTQYVNIESLHTRVRH